MAEAYDKKVFRIIAKSARTAHPITAGPGPEPGGSVINLGAGNEFNAQAIVDGFFEAASIFDEKNVPSGGRVAVLSPRQYYALISQVDTNILNRDYGNTQGNLNSGGGTMRSLASLFVVSTTCPSWLVLLLVRMVRTTITVETSLHTVV